MSCSSGPKVTFFNDLEIDVALLRCHSNRALADPIFLSAGEQKTSRTKLVCPILGPTFETGPLGLATHPGPYIGCLIITEEQRTQEQVVRISDVDRSVSFAECDK